jgi:hypothetical protein
MIVGRVRFLRKPSHHAAKTRRKRSSVGGAVPADPPEIDVEPQPNPPEAGPSAGESAVFDTVGVAEA